MINHNTMIYNKCGVTFIGLLQLIFIVLKLCGVINWSWVCVLLPLIIGVSLWILIFIFILVLAYISYRL